MLTKEGIWGGCAQVALTWIKIGFGPNLNLSDVVVSTESGCIQKLVSMISVYLCMLQLWVYVAAIWMRLH